MIIPVLDISNGIAVWGKSGKRETYKPLQSVFNNSANPLKIAKALKKNGAERMYIADLDAIENRGNNFNIIKEVNNIIPVTLDSGANNVYKAKKSLEVADKVIIATETLKDISDLLEIFKKYDKKRIIVSIDIKDEEIFSKHLDISLKELIKKINEIEPSEVILLDISRVGTEKGVNLALINQFLKIPTSLIIGGGITDEDINELEKLGLNKFLVGSVLHKGKLSAKFI
ncbi:HisA/HisF family protein [Methanobacterium oryzae]|uniref:HisA/HisF family protein n=1 Tax=Methanobacterium oryzae TaxID=69540 RepID=UPI003D238E5B